MNKLKSVGSSFDIHISDSASKIIRMEQIKKHLDESDMVYIQSPGSDDANTLIKLYHSEGKKVVVDYDDYSFGLNPGNPRYAELGTLEATAAGEDGSPAYAWRDQENGFDLKANKQKYEAFLKSVCSADCITTTTEYLADKFRKHNKNVAICPNSVDFDMWKPIDRPISMDQIRIGWFGGDSHFSDLKIFKTVIPEIVRKYADVKIVIQGPAVPEWREHFKDIPEDRMEWHHWTDLRYYPLFLAARHWDIGLCPLSDDEFNRCKSSIKFFEFAAVGAAVVAQDMLPYSENITHDENGFLAGTRDEWFEAISRLVENAEERKRMACAGFDYVHENFNIEKNCRIWEKTFTNVLEGN